VALFRELPGLDVTGVGPNQARPVIRGQVGQRVLLLSDGLRINNSRRQQDFGEIPALVDVDQLERIEVVRGPASVLYGTDAIGGVINLITVTPPIGNGDALHGSFGYRYGSAATEVRPNGSAYGRIGRFRFGLGATYRESHSYDAPAGRFGGLRLSQDTRVHDTGVQDESYRAHAGYTLGTHHDLLLGFDRYVADDAGFGYVDAADYGRPDDPFIQIRYPNQQVNRYTARYRGQELNSLFADRVTLPPIPSPTAGTSTSTSSSPSARALLPGREWCRPPVTSPISTPGVSAPKRSRCSLAGTPSPTGWIFSGIALRTPTS
jgi:outer membrane receptor protein involved in Fe transport